MSESKFTHGPWFVAEDERPGMAWNRHIHSAPNMAVCFMAHSDGREPERDLANARLIAAAPELLEALIRLCKNFPTDTDMAEAGWDATEVEAACSAYDAARAVVAKATGSQP